MDRENVVMPSIISNKHIIIESQWVGVCVCGDGGGGGMVCRWGREGDIFTRLLSWKKRKARL